MRKVWRILGWVVLVVVLAAGGLALWLPHWAMNDYHEMQQREAHTGDLRKICAQQLQQKTGITGHLDETLAASYYMAQKGFRGPNDWTIYGSWLSPQHQHKHFECKVTEQSNKTTVLDVHFMPPPKP